MKILVFGAGENGRACREYITRLKEAEFVGFLDNQKESAGSSAVNAKDWEVIYHPSEVGQLQYDSIWVSNGRPEQVAEIKEQLDELKVPKEKVRILLEDQTLIQVLSSYNHYSEKTDPRVIWLHNFAEYALEEKLAGSVAECGVFKGEFSYFINKYFPEKTLYLFDTFSGFDEQDLTTERSFNHDAFLNSEFNDHRLFTYVSEQIVLARVPHAEKCILKKGYFPETAAGITDQFCFVNLDMDLYQPTLSGLRFFYNKMCPGGVILLHDYFHPKLPGVKRAVAQFAEERRGNICKVPIGDSCSIAIIAP